MLSITRSALHLHLSKEAMIFDVNKLLHYLVKDLKRLETVERATRKEEK